MTIFDNNIFFIIMFHYQIVSVFKVMYQILNPVSSMTNYDETMYNPLDYTTKWSKKMFSSKYEYYSIGL